MTAISIKRIGEPVPSHSIKVQAQPEAIVAPDCVPRNALRPRQAVQPGWEPPNQENKLPENKTQASINPVPGGS